MLRGSLITLMKKLRGRSGKAGETLVETLVALTVAGLSMIMLAMAISVSTGIIARGAETANTYYSDNSALANTALSSDGTVSVERGASVGGSTSQVSVKYNVDSDIPGGGTAVSYEATEYKDPDLLLGTG